MFVVPVGGCSSDDETVGLDQEHEGPDQVDDMDDEKDLDGGGDLEMLERILMHGSHWLSQGVESCCLEKPQHQESDRDEEHHDRQQHNQAVTGDKVSCYLYDASRQGNPRFIADYEHHNEDSQDETDDCCNDAACRPSDCPRGRVGRSN